MRISQLPGRLVDETRKVVGDAAKVSFDLYKIMIPIIVAVKALRELDLVRYLAWPLEPLMGLVDLPADMGLVWATAMLSNLYAAIVVYASLAADAPPLTVAQVTILATMLLIAHNLPVELRITQKSGASLLGQAALRVGGALACGMLLLFVYNAFSLYQEPSAMAWAPAEPGGGLMDWTLSEFRKLGMIFCVIAVLMAVMRVLNALRVTDGFMFLLGPLLRLMGIGKQAATISIIGLSMGIAYGGGLIIHEAKKGELGKTDLFASLSLMSLAHALVEDTLLMMLLGASLSGILWGRLLFALATVAVLARLYAYWRGGGAGRADAVEKSM